MELGAFCAQLFDSALQLLDRIRLPRIDRGEEGETLRVAFDDGGNEVIGHRRPVGRRLGIPGEQDAEDLFLGELDGELVDRSLVHVTAKIAGCPLTVRTHAAIEPFLQGQMDMKVDRADQVYEASGSASSSVMRSPTAIDPPFTTRATMPRRPTSSSFSPMRISSMRKHGSQIFMISSTALSPNLTRVPAGKPIAWRPSTVRFSLMVPGSTPTSSSASWSASSTCRSEAATACLSPSIPTPVIRVAVGTSCMGCRWPGQSWMETMRAGTAKDYGMSGERASPAPGLATMTAHDGGRRASGARLHGRGAGPTDRLLRRQHRARPAELPHQQFANASSLYPRPGPNQGGGRPGQHGARITGGTPGQRHPAGRRGSRGRKIRQGFRGRCFPDRPGNLDEYQRE